LALNRLVGRAIEESFRPIRRHGHVFICFSTDAAPWFSHSKQSTLAGQVMLALPALSLERDRQTTASVAEK
jgi:hypothetical protein